MSRIQFWSNNRGCAAYEAAGIDWLIAHLEAERDAARLGCARLRDALTKVRGYNVSIISGQISYRPEDHIAVIDAALRGNTHSAGMKDTK